MKYLAIVLILLVTACVPVTTPALPTVDANKVQVGDSICADSEYFSVAAQLVGFARDCVPGRRLIDYGDLPDVEVVVVSLITNDIINATPVEDYRLSLQQKLVSTDARVYCVLAVLRDYPEQETYNQVMRDECPNIIDPRDCGVFPAQADGIHWDEANNQSMQQCLNTAI